jgi:hypothetical protein
MGQVPNRVAALGIRVCGNPHGFRASVAAGRTRARLGAVDPARRFKRLAATAASRKSLNCLHKVPLM